jgi:transposase
MDQKYWVGLDKGEASTGVCVLGADEAPLLERTSTSDASETAQCLSPFPRDGIAAVAMESGAAHSLVRKLAALGLPIVLLDAGKVSRFLSIRHHKTDRNDARGIAEIARQNRHAHLRSYIRDVECQRIRDQLIIRNQLVHQRTASRNALRSMLRNQGSAIRQLKSGKGLRKQVEAELDIIERVAGQDAASASRSLLELHEAQSRFVEQSDKRLARVAADIPEVQRFLKIPGVGPICAISFYSTIGDPHRFSNTASVGPYLGMVPKLKQSGLELRRSGITKAGDTLAHRHLVLSAGVMISRAAGDSAVRDWGRTLVGKKGYGKARLAVARKLAVIMLSIWKSGDDFRPYPT